MPFSQILIPLNQILMPLTQILMPIDQILSQILMPLSQILMPRLSHLDLNALVNSSRRDRINRRTWHTKLATWRPSEDIFSANYQMRRPGLPETSLSCKDYPYILPYCQILTELPSFLLCLLIFVLGSLCLIKVIFSSKKFLLYYLGCGKCDWKWREIFDFLL